jgi:hypothetical protein
VAIGPFETAEVAAFAAGVAAGNEKRHARRLRRLGRSGRRLLRLCENDYAHRNKCYRRQQRYSRFHRSPPFKVRGDATLALAKAANANAPRVPTGKQG